MPLKQRDVESGLKVKGFREAETHHRYFIYWTLDGKKTAVKTHTSHGAKEIDDSLISKMARQCHLSSSEFRRLVECPLKQPEYEKILLDQQIIKLPEPKIEEKGHKK
jgi:hypothetical protein